MQFDHRYRDRHIFHRLRTFRRDDRHVLNPDILSCSQTAQPNAIQHSPTLSAKAPFSIASTI